LRIISPKRSPKKASFRGHPAQWLLRRSGGIPQLSAYPLAEESGQTALFLARNGFITGQTLSVSGGLTLPGRRFAEHRG